MTECQFHKDEVIFEQGQPASHLYILLSGNVIVRYKPYDGPPLTVANIEPGGVFGWSAALGRETYTSSAVTVQESVAVRVRGSNLQVIRAQYPETGKILMDRLAGVITERLHSSHTQVLEILTRGFDVDGNWFKE
ncbi:MAG: Crp/Fnr family transcriptional regulator [Chloroflexi bacterium]|nr:Crp/Fnr family transcriptional regulator [Chloroflexota bacterium]